MRTKKTKKIKFSGGYYSLREIADILGVSEQSVSQTYFIAMEKIKTIMQKKKYSDFDISQDLAL